MTDSSLPEDADALFSRGAALFDDQNFFEAHEVWEDLWYIESGPDKFFAQGLVQFAVLCVHLERGNARGVRAVHQSATLRLNQAPETYRGLSRGHIISELDRVAGPTLRLEAKHFGPGLPKTPGLLPTDPAGPPKLK